MKRLFCSVIAAAMLLSVSVIGVGAATEFADAADITYTEAVAAAAEKGLFAGSEDEGKSYFKPKDTVTRAQMATVMVKLIMGSDFDANPYKGEANMFSDTADYQRGWAEGFIAACSMMGIVKGYGNGTFGPDDVVTAAQAVTMIINALKVDAGQGEWPTTVMNKAMEMGLFGEITPMPSANDPMSREQLAVIVMQGVKYLEAEKESDSSGSSSSGSSSSSSSSSGSSSSGSSSSGSSSSGSSSSGSSSSGSSSSGSSSSGSSSSNSSSSGSSSSGGSNRPSVVPKPSVPTPSVPEIPVEPEEPPVEPEEPSVDPNEPPIIPADPAEPETPVTPAPNDPDTGTLWPEDYVPGPNETPLF